MEKTKTVSFYDWQIDNGCAEKHAERTNGALVAQLLEWLKPGAHLLDLGCLTGALAAQLVSRGVKWERYVGVDLSKKAIGIFRDRKVVLAEPMVGDATDLSHFQERSFDAVLCVFLLQDLPKLDGERLLRGIGTVLKPDGCLVVALTVHPEYSRDLGSDYKPGALADKGIPGKFTYLWNKNDLERVLNQSGFRKQRESETKTEAGLLENYSLWCRAAQPTIAAEGFSPLC